MDISEDGRQVEPHDVAVWDDTEPGDKSPFVVDGGGAPCGLDKDEHFQWALTKEHPFIEKGPYKVDTDTHFWSAMEFENMSTAESRLTSSEVRSSQTTQ